MNTRKFFVFLAIVALAIFAGGIVGCDNGKSRTEVNVINPTGNDSDNENCQDQNTEYSNKPYSYLLNAGDWQVVDIPEGADTFYIEEENPRQFSCDDGSVLVKIKRGYHNGEKFYVQEEFSGVYIRVDWQASSGECPVTINNYFPEVTFDVQWAPEGESGTGTFRTRWAGYYVKTVDNSNVDTDADIVNNSGDTTSDPADPPYNTEPEIGNCQNDGYKRIIVGWWQGLISIHEIFAELNRVDDKGMCKLKLNYKFSTTKVITLICWKKVYVSMDWVPADGKPIDLKDYFPEFDFVKQYQPTDAGDIDTIWVGRTVNQTSCQSSYLVKGTQNWQWYFPLEKLFVEVNDLGNNIFKIKLNIMVIENGKRMVYTIMCWRDVLETRDWSSAVLKEYLPNFDFKWQGVPRDAYITEKTVWAGTNTGTVKPSSLK